jgi:cytochrome oxidase Cu insertion factor (SCO1/SenC/PrrC family)
LLAITGVVSSGVWLGHRLDPTWGRGGAGLRRAIPFPVPSIAAAHDLGGGPWILELRFPGCGADDAEVSARVSALAGRVHARGGADLGWLTLLVGGLPDQASSSPGRRRIAPLAPGALADLAAQLGLAGSARAAADGLLDARHWLFAVDGGGWVRGAVDITGGSGWRSFEDAALAAARSPLRPASNPEAPVAAASVRLVPFQAVDQDGRAVTERDFAGHPLVVDFIFTRCMGPCPMMTARLAALRRMVPDPDAWFLSFSVDPAHDTPAVLRDYAARWGTPDPRWRLLAADAATVQAVARGLGELVAERADGLLLHSEHFTLLDGSGRVRARVASTEIKMLAAQLSAREARAADTGDAPAGARLFASLGCGGCHGNRALGPPLGGLAGRRVHLADGRTVAADDRYLRASITSPLDAVVDGFRPSMPSYGGLLSDSELATLVDYLKSLRD